MASEGGADGLPQLIQHRASVTDGLPRLSKHRASVMGGQRRLPSASSTHDTCAGTPNILGARISRGRAGAGYKLTTAKPGLQPKTAAGQATH